MTDLMARQYWNVPCRCNCRQSNILTGWPMIGPDIWEAGKHQKESPSVLMRCVDRAEGAGLLAPNGGPPVCHVMTCMSLLFTQVSAHCSAADAAVGCASPGRAHSLATGHRNLTQELRLVICTRAGAHTQACGWQTASLGHSTRLITLLSFFAAPCRLKQLCRHGT